MLVCVIVFFFKQKTAYEMRISDWSSDVCSSDLARPANGVQFGQAFGNLDPEFGFGISSRAVQLVDLARNDLQYAIPILGFDSERLTPKLSVRPHDHGLRLQCYRELIAWRQTTKKSVRGAKTGLRQGLADAQGDRTRTR